MQSHRADMSPSQLGKIGELGMALGAFVGRDALATLCDASSLLDLLCRFQSNSFALTTSDLSNVGVAVCPLAALINHDCSPNAVIVWPDGTDVAQCLRVIAIRPIAAGEEILTSYVDLALPRHLRQAELRDRYHFTCTCYECATTSRTPDPRRALKCRKDGCSALASFSEGESGMTRCTAGHEVVVDPDLASAIRRVVHIVADASSQPSSSSSGKPASVRSDDRLILFRSLALSSHPLLALLRRDQLDAIDAGRWHEAAAFAERVMRGMEAVYTTPGHPARAVQRAALAKLQVVIMPTGDPKAVSRARASLVAAREELDIAFGKGGGRAGLDMRQALQGLDEEVEMLRRRGA